MDVSGISNSNSLYQLLLQLQQNGQAGSIASVNNSDFTQILNNLKSGNSNMPNPSDLSKQAEMFAKLQKLATDDPEKFKTTMTEIADKMESTAEAMGDSREKEMLTKMAAQFRKAAETGDPNDLPQPPQGPPPPPPGGMQSGIGMYMMQQQSSSNNQSLLDLLTNQSSSNNQSLLDLLTNQSSSNNQSLLDLLASQANQNSGATTQAASNKSTMDQLFASIKDIIDKAVA